VTTEETSRPIFVEVTVIMTGTTCSTTVVGTVPISLHLFSHLGLRLLLLSEATDTTTSEFHSTSSEFEASCNLSLRSVPPVMVDSTVDPVFIIV